MTPDGAPAIEISCCLFPGCQSVKTFLNDGFGIFEQSIKMLLKSVRILFH